MTCIPGAGNSATTRTSVHTRDKPVHHVARCLQREMGSRDVCCRVAKKVLVQCDYLLRDGSVRHMARAARAEEKEKNEMMPLRSRLIYIAPRPWVVKRFSGKRVSASKIGQKQTNRTPTRQTQSASKKLIGTRPYLNNQELSGMQRNN